MRRTAFLFLAAVSAAVLLSNCALHGQAGDPALAFAGDWTLTKSFGVTSPPEWRMNVQSAGGRLTIRSHWQEPKNGQYGLTLLGLTTPEFVLDPTSKEKAAQVGPFVMRYRSEWDAGKLITHWSTSEFMASRFQGTWTRAVSKDGATQTVDIEATAQDGEVSRARLIYERFAK